jgi:hypothetical protein
MGAIWRDSWFRETDFWVWRWSHLNVDALSRPSATEAPVSCLDLDRIQLFFDEGMEGCEIVY